MIRDNQTKQTMPGGQVVRQIPLLEAQTTWFHVFKSMVDSGDIAQMGPYATTVYMVIKAYTNWKTGKSWPGIELIIEKTGISRAQVMRSLNILEANGYITKEKVGRHNKYTLREKVPVLSGDGDDRRPVAEATWDYLPSTVKAAVAELQNFIVTGDIKGLNVIHIENLTLNLQQNIECRDVQQQNIGMPGALESVDWQSIPDDNPVKKAFLASRKTEPRE